MLSDVMNANWVTLFLLLSDNLTWGWQEILPYFLQIWSLTFRERRLLSIPHISTPEKSLVSCVKCSSPSFKAYFSRRLGACETDLVFQVKRAHCPMALWLMGASRASLKHTKERTMLSLRRGTLKAKRPPSTPSSTTKMTSVSTDHCIC